MNKILFSLLLLFLPISANPTDRMQAMVDALHKTAEEGQAIIEEIKLYQDLQEQYQQNPLDKEKALLMITSAAALLRHVEQESFTHLLPDAFVEEIALFSEMNKKKIFPKL